MGATKKDLLMDQLAACKNDLSWFPTFQDSIEGLTAYEATWQKHESSHSIWKIVTHLTFWNEKWLKRFMDKESFESTANNSLTFEGPNQTITEKQWNNVVSKLDSVYTDWLKALKESPESKLDEVIANYPGECPWWGAVSNLCTHNAYHIGQIVYIRKQERNWQE
ncbi:DinB family protein [Bacillus sp. FJAT-49736]|uniref:DinB family protein n=1 Tax=Bacillus sp. FJAT-49736 TaxID=2833582 RepID=UPI001BC9DA72|nr:DinB family protein [Bacillus sp. FJAT-49736]MBS4172187.1 DinB family protein [Bacillus sp. FJAT-49736]